MAGLDNLVFLIAYILGCSQYLIAGRRRMMTVKVVSSLFFVAYMLLLDAHTGAIACGIAALGSFMQAVFPDHMLARTRILRLSLAVGLAVTASFVAARTPQDLLPLLATVNSRLVETQSCQQRIRIGLLFSTGLWTVYHWEQGFYLLFGAAIIEMGINAYSIWSHARKTKKTVPIPA